MANDWRELVPDDLEELVRVISDHVATRHHVAYPAIVTEDTDGNTVKLKIGVKAKKRDPKTGEVSYVELPELQTVPVHYAGGGAKDEDTTLITHPVKVYKDQQGKKDDKKSDEGIIIIGRGLDNWHEKSGAQQPMDMRQQTIDGGLFVPGIRSKPRKHKWHDNKSTQIRSFDKKHVINTDPKAGHTIKSVESAQDKQQGSKEENDPYEKPKDYYYAHVQAKSGVLTKATKDEGSKGKTKNHTTSLTHDGHTISIGRAGKDGVHTHTASDKGIKTSVESGKHTVDVHADNGIQCNSSKTCDITAPTHNVNAVTNLKKETTIDKVLTCKDNINCSKNVLAQLFQGEIGQFGIINGTGGGGGGIQIGQEGGTSTIPGSLSILGGLSTGALEVAKDADGGLTHATKGLQVNGATKLELFNYPNDAAAQAGGIEIGQLYQTNGTVKVRNI